MSEEQQNYYAVIPSYILNAKDITSDEKLLYALISSLSNDKGFCYASNAYFAKRFGKSESSIKRWLSNLVSKNYVSSKVNYKPGSKQVESRNLNICNDLGPEMNPPGFKNEPTPGSKSELDSIKDINNKDYINIYKKKGPKIPTLLEIQKQIELKGYDVDAEKFNTYYDANNWAGVKNWKLRLATWHNNSKDKPKKKEEPTDADIDSWVAELEGKENSNELEIRATEVL